MKDRQTILEQLFSLADTTDNSRKAKEIITNFRGSRSEIYDLYDIFESSPAFGYIHTKLAKL